MPFLRVWMYCTTRVWTCSHEATVHHFSHYSKVIYSISALLSFYSRAVCFILFIEVNQQFPQFFVICIWYSEISKTDVEMMSRKLWSVLLLYKLIVFHRSLDNSKWPQVSGTPQRILVDLNNAMVWTFDFRFHHFFPCFWNCSKRTNYNWYHRQSYPR